MSHGGGPGGFATSTNPVKAAATCALPTNPAPVRPDARGAHLAARRVGDEEHADAREQVPDARRRHARAEHERGDGLSRDSRQADRPKGCSTRSSTTISGPQFRYADQSGVLTKFRSRKARCLSSSSASMPTATRWPASNRRCCRRRSAPTPGWNVTTSGLYKGQLCGSSFGSSPIGGFIPFAKTKAERTASGDPRLSLEERYIDHDGYVRAVKTAADKLVRDGYLLADDAASMISQAEQSQVLR